MKSITSAGVLAAAIAVLASPLAFAEPQANAPADMKITDQQCDTLWQQAGGTGSTELTADKVQKFVKDFKKADANANSKLSATEWKDACAKGYVMSQTNVPAPGGATGAPADNSASKGASTGESSTPPPATPGAATSDRTPGHATERAPGASNTGAAGTEQGQTPSGTSDRTPNK